MLLILPGYSLHNKDWAEEVKKNIEQTTNNKVLVHNWRHWTEGSFSLTYEISKIKEEIAKETNVDIIAKSVGVAVAMEIIPQISSQVGKVVFCGIASITGSDREAALKNVLDVVSVKNILCIQNAKDKFVKYSDAEKFYHSINHALKVISKPRSDHEYPYFPDFEEFLK
jgi:predicted alpha/beta hydrolase family esterase